MSPGRSASSLALLAAVGAACTPTTTPKPKTVPIMVPTAPKAAEPQPESPARWVIRTSVQWRPSAKLSSGGATVYAGKGGERWLAQKGGGRLVHAPKLIPEDVEAITQLAGRFLFAGQSGTLYATPDPLGPVLTTTAAPSEMRSVAAGKSAVVGITLAGELLRTTDGGVKWNKPASFPKANGVLVRAAMDANGNGLALMVPQRIFTTKDDGDSWTPVATPGIGATNVLTDMAGTVYLMGYNEYATLSGGTLNTTTSYPRFEMSSKPGEDEDGYGKVFAITGSRYVEAFPFYDAGNNKWKVRTAALGSTAKAQVLSALDGCGEVHVSAWESSIVLACDLKGAPSPGPGAGSYPRTESTRFIRSDDGGATFHDDITVESAEPRWSPTPIVAGPNGWLFINARCHWGKKGQECLPARIRPAGSDAFQPVTVAGLPVGGPGKKNGWSSELEIRQVQIVPSKGLVYMLGNHRGEHRVYAAKLGEADFVRKLDSELDAGWGESAFSVEEDGTINLMAHDQGAWTLRRGKEDQSINQSLIVPIDFEKVELVGKRGLGFDQTGKGWETGDSGQHWMEVAAPVERGEPRSIACSSFGCILDGRMRIGWDLPATAMGGKVVAAVPAIDAPKPTMGRRGKPVVHGKTVWATPLKCSVKDHWTSVGPWMAPSGQWLPGANQADVAPGIRWMVAKRGDQGRMSVLYAVPNKEAVASTPPKGIPVPVKGLLTKEVLLLGPESEDEKLGVVTKDFTRPGGLVAVRYTWKRSEGDSTPSYGYGGKDDKNLNPVDVEIAWFDAVTQKTHKGMLKQLPPFRAPLRTSYDPALVWLSNGGVWFHTIIREAGAYQDKGALFFIKDDGKVEKMTWPENAQTPVSYGIDRIPKDGGRVVLFQVQDSYNGQMQMLWANETGSSWTKRTWGIAPGNEALRRGEDYRRVDIQALPALFGKMSLGVSWNHGKTNVGFAFPIAMDADPPEVFVIPPQKSLGDPPRVCDATGSQGARVITHWAPGTRHPVLISGETEKGYLQKDQPLLLATTSAVVRMPKTGEPCLSAYELGREGYSSFTGILAPNDLQNGTLFFRDSAPTGGTLLVSRPISCAFEPGNLPDDLSEEEGFSE